MKNKKIKIEKGHEKLTNEDISRGKDFTNVHKDYLNMKTNWFKSPKKFGSVSAKVVVTMIVAAVTVGVWKFMSSHKTIHKQGVVTTKHIDSNKTAHANFTRAPRTGPYVHPPIKGVNVPYKTYTVDANKANTITYNKSKIKIPAKAFCDANGKEVTGKVDIKYREFHNPVDFFVSGIPMTYDSAGQQYVFESAGMMDMQGYKDGKQINIKADKAIQVEMASTERDIHYNIYQLDTVSKNWVYKSQSNNVVQQLKDTIQKFTIDPALQKQTTQAENTLANSKKEETNVEKQKPIEPKVYSDYSRVFNIDADKTEFPELNVYKNVLFEVDKNDKDFKPSYTQFAWEDASLTKKDDGVEYTFTVKRGNESHRFTVRPVFDKKDYNAAMKEYDKKYAEYQTTLNKKIEEEKKEEAAYTELQRKQKEAEQRWQQAMAMQANALAKTYDIVSYFSVNKFGIVNCDHPGVEPKGASVIANFINRNSQEQLNIPCVYLVEKGRNSLFNYYPGLHFLFNPKAQNFAWCVTDSNKVAIFTVEDFKKINQTSGTYTFGMMVSEAKVETMEDIKAFFKPYM